MATITIETSVEEQERVLEALRQLEGKTVSATAIGTKAGMPGYRVRYVIADLEEAGKIKRIPTKAFNAHYIRYKYEVLV